MQTRDLQRSPHVHIWFSTNWTSSSWSFLFHWHKKPEHLTTNLVIWFCSDLATMHEYFRRTWHIIWQLIFRRTMNFGGAHKKKEPSCATVNNVRYIYILHDNSFMKMKCPVQNDLTPSVDEPNKTDHVCKIASARPGTDDSLRDSYNSK